MKTVRLKPGRDKPFLRRHPWVFAGGIAAGGGDAGETVRIEAADGRFLAWAAYSPRSQIRARVWSFDEAMRIDAGFFGARIAAAAAHRAALGLDGDACRLVHGEADGLPGLIVDRYGEVLVVQILSAGAERWRETLADALAAETGCAAIFERSDAPVRKLEGFEARSGWLRGEGATRLVVTEHGRRFAVDVAGGHKTGFYLDQRDNRALFADWVARTGARSVLDAYCYTGGFTAAALAGGAETVVAIDSSAHALVRARENMALNGFDPDRTEFRDDDVNTALRSFAAEGRRFDAIVLDPPKFAPTAAQVQRAARAYKDINLYALRLLRPGGVLFTFSCSGAVGPELFQKIVAGAAADAGADGYLCRRLEAAPDHPATLAFPEGEYLTGLVVVRRAEVP